MSGPRPLSTREKLVLFGGAFLLLVLLITSVFGRKGVLEIYRIRRSHAALLREIEVLEKEKARLEKEIEALKRDPRAVDREARDKLWLIGPEEKVIIKKGAKPNG